MTEHLLQGRHVVVTGAGGGVGPAVVTRLLQAGAVCHAPERRPAPAGPRAAASERLHVSGGIDLTDEGAVARFYAGLPPLWASVHVAGGYAGRPVADSTLADVQGQLDRNFITAYLCCREAVRSIRRSGAGGRIVNFSSRAALAPAAGAAAYAASKAAVSALTQALAQEVRGERIQVNALAPGTIDTPANRAAMPGADPGGWIKPEAIAETVLWLLSPASTAVTGATIPLG